MPVVTESDGKGNLQAAQGNKVAEKKDQVTAAVAHAAHKANPGPVIADKMPEAESKEDLKKRTEELNKS